MIPLQNIRIAVVGTGISGLTALYEVLKNDFSHKIAVVTLFEKESHVGGVLNCTRSNEYIFEHGAQGILASRESMIEFIQELGLENRVSFPESKFSHRFLLYKNKVLLFSLKNLKELFKYKLLNFWVLLRIFKEFFVKKPEQLLTNETVHEFFTRRFGAHVSKFFIAALMKGIWAGGSHKILMRHSFQKLQHLEQQEGSLLKFALKTGLRRLFSFPFSQKNKKSKRTKKVISFVNGMQELPLGIFEKIEEMCRARRIELNIIFKAQVVQIHSLSKKDSVEREVQVQYKKLEENKIYIQVDHVVIYSGQPWRDKELNFENDKNCQTYLSELRKMENYSIAVVGLGDQKQKFPTPPLEGFGALSAENEQSELLGVISVHTLQKNHVPHNCALYRVMLGGEYGEHITRQSKEKIIFLAKKSLHAYELVQKNIKYEFEDFVIWPNYMPLLTANHEKILKAIWSLEATIPGLFLTGNYIVGPSVNSCVEQAQEVAKKINRFMED